jgi:phage baseplate assembly protein gpV
MLTRLIEFIEEKFIPYDDAISDLMAKIEELERKQRNIVQAGRVVDIHADGQRIKVAFGDNETPYINWFSSSAGKVREYRCPTVGEQCVLLNYGGGDNSTQTWALTGMPSGQFPASENNPDVHLIDWGGGMSLSVDTATNKIIWNIPAELIINTPLIKSTGELKTAGDQIAGTVSTQKHKHDKVVVGPAISGEPVK